MSLFTLVVIALIVAQFTEPGRRFLATERGAAITVAVSAVAIVSMIPGLLMGNLLNAVFIGLWGYVAYPRLYDAKRYAKRGLRNVKDKLRIGR